MGSIDMPITPLSIALAAECSFVARALDIDKNLGDILEQAAKHKGTSFVEIYQDCNIFNHGAFDYATNKESKEDNTIRLEHGKPIIFGKHKNKGIRLHDHKPEIVDLENSSIKEDDLLFHNEDDESLAFLLSRMRTPAFPEPLGIFYRVEDTCYEKTLTQQVTDAIAKNGKGTLETLLNSGDTYEITE